MFSPIQYQSPDPTTNKKNKNVRLTPTPNRSKLSLLQHFQQQQQQNQSPSSSMSPQAANNNNSNSNVAPTEEVMTALKSPIPNLSSLSVRRLRAMVNQHGNIIDSSDPVQKSLSNEVSHRFLSSPSPSQRKKKLHEQQQQQQLHQQEKQEEEDKQQQQKQQQDQEDHHDRSVATDLSMLTGGAPVPQIFAFTKNLNQSDLINNSNDDDTDLLALEVVSPVRKSKTELLSASRSPSSSSEQKKSNILSLKHAKFLDEELSLRLQFEREKQQHQQQQKQKHMENENSMMIIPFTHQKDNNFNKNNKKDNNNNMMIPIQVVLHCREVAHQLADKFGAGVSGYSQLLHRIVEILSQYGEQQHEDAVHAKSQFEEIKMKMKQLEYLIEEGKLSSENNDNNNNTADHKNHHHINKKHHISSQDATSPINNNTSGTDGDDEENTEAERKRLVALTVELQGEKAAQKEIIDQLTRAKQEIQTRLDDQFETSKKREEEYRSLSGENTERYEELARQLNLKSAVIQSQKDEIKELETDLDEKLWLQTIESESTQIVTTMLRKHTKDTEARSALMAMRLRQEQEQNLKLRRKLADLVPSVDEILEEYLEGTVPAAVVNTPRPNKEAIVRAVPAIGRSQVTSSTSSIVDGLLSLIQSLEERLKVETKSFEQARFEADRILDEKRNQNKPIFCDVDVQTEEIQEEETDDDEDSDYY